MTALMHIVIVAIGSIQQVSLPVPPIDNRNAPKVVTISLGKTLLQADITVGAGVYGPFDKGTK
jgi:hypothetical protein